ncbi:hypothetical protein BJ912DRAFT_1054194 [Pholiota molesta]|nr:hypothetical protein BJ912DRAFT_1054194 [Pholiota molesta]
MNQNKYSSNAQWNGASQQYPTGVTVPYAQNGYYPSMSMTPNASPQQGPPVYADTDPRSVQAAYQEVYYNNSAHYSSPVNQHVYSSVSPPVPMNYAQAQSLRSGHHIPRPRSTVPQTAYSHSPTHSYSHPYPQAPSSPTHPVHPQIGRVRSNSQVYDRAPSPTGYAQSPEPYYAEIPIPQTIGISSDYPTSSIRPFSCDLCALSFNRQHDLKRHRETHTGEKPYLCNGGCGKTFTRKDALKRHQLVKNCGKVDESWA